MFLLVVIGPLVLKMNGALHFPDWFIRQFDHGWGGFTLWDIIMPLFIFMCGAAVPFGLGKRLVDGRPTFAYWRHVLGRVAMLWFFGMLVQGRFLSFDPMVISPFNNTLQAIAVGYLVAALIYPIRWKPAPWAATALLFVIYGVSLAWCGDYSRDGNFAMRVERLVFPLFVPSGSKALAMQDPGYTWFFTSCMFAAMTLIGMICTQLIRAEEKNQLRNLSILGGSLLILGAALSLGVPVIKHIYTVSFTALAMGICTLLLTGLYWLVDVKGVNRGLGLITVFGQHALLMYMLNWL